MTHLRSLIRGGAIRYLTIRVRVGYELPLGRWECSGDRRLLLSKILPAVCTSLRDRRSRAP